MRKLIIAGAVAAALFAVSCDTLNIGGNLPGWGPNVSLGAMPTAAANFSGENFTFSATWVGGTSPYAVSWNFGADFTPGTANANTAGTSDSQTVALNNAAGSTGTVSVTVTDAQSLPGSASGTYAFGPQQNVAPTLTVTGGDGTTSITVQADDADGDSVTITPSVTAGFTAGAAQTVASGASATFNFSADDIFAGGNGTATFDGDDGNGGTAQATASVAQGAIVLAADTIYAIPLSSSAAAGDPVTVVIASGVPANPFTYCNGVRVTGPTGFAYVANSFNAGNVGGAAGDNDGTWWGAMTFSGFLLAPDNFIVSTDLGGGTLGWDFSLNPTGASADATNPSGAIFNFQATFAAGTNTLGFQDQTGAVKRTFYADINQVEFLWGDFSNNHAGIPNSVTAN